VVRALLTWLIESYAWVRLTDEQKAAGIISEPKGIGKGVGLSVGLFLMLRMSMLGSKTIRMLIFSFSPELSSLVSHFMIKSCRKI
jgi:hypothetical protein